MSHNLAKDTDGMHGELTVLEIEIEFTVPARINFDQRIKKNVICYFVGLDAFGT